MAPTHIGLPDWRRPNAPTGQDDGALTGLEQFLATAEASLLDARCRLPIARANKASCATLVRTIESCQQHFGPFTLRCSSKAATACCTNLAEIQNGYCGVRWSIRWHSKTAHIGQLRGRRRLWDSQPVSGAHWFSVCVLPRKVLQNAATMGSRLLCSP